MDNPEEKYFADMPSTRRSAVSTDPDVGRMVDFTREGIEQLQEDIGMPQGLVDALCQATVDYYNKHRRRAPSSTRASPAVSHGAGTPLNPRGDIKAL